jgi:hypothetical protein
MDSREQFLLAMYSEAWRNVERHILVVWQTAGVVGATLAVFVIVEKKVIPSDIALTMEFVVVGWLYAHIVDAQFWFARNLHIITNIERQFLKPSDISEIHPYFAPRSTAAAASTLDHLQIQKWLARALFICLLVLHGIVTFREGWSSTSILPFLAAIGSIVAIGHFKAVRSLKQRRLEEESPGKRMMHSEASRDGI